MLERQRLALPGSKILHGAPVNPVYNAIGWISEKILKRKMQKEMAELRK
ncbi:MAG: hypothetical protein QG610_2261 [Euryarchaeota archaeon]|nr:hypothetical protein [Euryarchaeota archaeon]